MKPRMTDTTETRMNTPSLKEKLTERLHDWIDRTAPLMHLSDRQATLTITMYTGETQYLDDDTPYVDARTEETLQTDSVGGWIDDKRPTNEPARPPFLVFNPPEHNRERVLDALMKMNAEQVVKAAIEAGIFTMDGELAPAYR